MIQPFILHSFNVFVWIMADRSDKRPELDLRVVAEKIDLQELLGALHRVARGEEWFYCRLDKIENFTAWKIQRKSDATKTLLRLTSERKSAIEEARKFCVCARWKGKFCSCYSCTRTCEQLRNIHYEMQVQNMRLQFLTSVILQLEQIQKIGPEHASVVSTTLKTVYEPSHNSWYVT